jgi:hypothetical protein
MHCSSLEAVGDVERKRAIGHLAPRRDIGQPHAPDGTVPER